MIHQMNLQHEYFLSIKNKTKVVEMRLNDEKRQLIKINDYILFKDLLTDELIKAEVIDIKKYANFKSLYEEHNKEEIGYEPNEVADYHDMEMYYDPEKIKKYGCLAIRIKVLD